MIFWFGSKGKAKPCYQLTFNQEVMGSNPIALTNEINELEITCSNALLAQQPHSNHGSGRW